MPVPLPARLCPAGTQVFKNNLALCVKLEDAEIKAMVDLAARSHCEELMDLLYHIVKIPKDDMPVKHNQHLVIKYVMQQRNEILTLTRPDERQRQIALLEGVRARDPHARNDAAGPAALAHARAHAPCGAPGTTDAGRAPQRRGKGRGGVPLGAGAAAGNVLRGREPVHRVHVPKHLFRPRPPAGACAGRPVLASRPRADECDAAVTARVGLGQILTNDKIPMSWRQPYLRFLLWAYVNADTENEKYNMNDLQYESALWTFLEMLAKHISAVANQVRVQ